MSKQIRRTTRCGYRRVCCPDGQFDAPGPELHRIFKETGLPCMPVSFFYQSSQIVQLGLERSRSSTDGRNWPLRRRCAEYPKARFSAAQRHGGCAENAIMIVAPHRIAITFGKQMRLRNEPVLTSQFYGG